MMPNQSSINAYSVAGERHHPGKGEAKRELSDGEPQWRMPVALGGRIPECRRLDFIVIAEAGIRRRTPSLKATR
jgi:hypothetical protein